MADAVKLLSSMATRELLDELAEGFRRASGQTVICAAAGGVDVARRVQDGESVDVVVLASTAIDKLLNGGRLAGGRVDLVRSAIAVGVKAGARKPDLATEETTKQAVLAATSLSFSTGPSGVYLEGLFEHWGILETIRSRIVVPPPGVPVGSLVARGAVELGFQQLSELANLPGIDVAGPLPPSIQSITVFSAALAARAAAPDAARALIEYLASPATAAIKRRHGMEPA